MLDMLVIDMFYTYMYYMYYTYIVQKIYNDVDIYDYIVFL